MHKNNIKGLVALSIVALDMFSFIILSVLDYFEYKHTNIFIIVLIVLNLLSIFLLVIFSDKLCTFYSKFRENKFIQDMNKLMRHKLSNKEVKVLHKIKN